jgi:hypothetical protein
MLRWTTPGMILREVASRSGFTWRLSIPTGGVRGDVDGLAYPLHRPMVHSCQARGQGFPPGVVSSYRCSRR